MPKLEILKKYGMKQIFTLLCYLAFSFLNSTTCLAQVTTITTGLPSSATSLTATQAALTFVIANNNSYPIILTSMSFYRASNQNSLTFYLRYSSTSLSGQPSPVVANWPLVATTTSGIVSTTAIHPLFTSLNFTIPANTTYRFAMQHTGSAMNYGGASTTPNSFTSNGVTIGTGNYQIAGQNVGYSGSSASSLTFSPRFWCGTITFMPAIANNLSALTLTEPLNNSQWCDGASIEVKTRIKNEGSAAQSNFQVGAHYTGPTTGSLSTTYTGTLVPGAVDTVTVGVVNLPGGSYSMKSYTMLVTDSVKANDTTVASLFTVKPPVPLPSAVSDTVCMGGNALVHIDNVPTGATIKWYSAASGGLPINIGTNLTFSSMTQDTTMYVSSTLNGCESGRVQISAAIGPAPIVSFGPDTSFCESVPLILDAGNAGGSYIWSTGDTTQTIAITNTSGQYWVEVDKYCLASDTINVTVAPVPVINGISYVRMNNAYHFSASGAQYVSDYLWIFGDGETLAGTTTSPGQAITAIHTYANGINEALEVKLVVNNNCGTDTVFRLVPTGIDDLGNDGEIIQVYPNPARTEVTIVIEKGSINGLQLFDAHGKLVKSKELKGSRNSLDLRDLAAGLYMLHVRSDGLTYSKPLQVIR